MARVCTCFILLPCIVISLVLQILQGSGTIKPEAETRPTGAVQDDEAEPEELPIWGEGFAQALPTVLELVYDGLPESAEPRKHLLAPTSMDADWHWLSENIETLEHDALQGLVVALRRKNSSVDARKDFARGETSCWHRCNYHDQDDDNPPCE